MDDDIVITGVSVVCPVGHTARTAFTSVKAGIARISEPADLRFLDDRGKRQTAACGAVDGVSDGHRRFLRIYRMAVRAFTEVVAHAQLDAAQVERMPVFLAVAEPERPGWDARVETALMRRIKGALGLRHEASGTTVVRAGHAAAYLALAQAIAAITGGSAERAVVGGVDSYLDEFTLQWLNEMGRLKREVRPGGFVPGEGAAFFVVERRSAAVERQAGCYSTLRAVGNAFEDNGVYEKSACLGAGLTQAVNSAMAGAQAHGGIGLIVCDLNGERHRANEWGLVMPRCLPSGDTPTLWHPADGCGDTGAASGATNIVLATLALARGHAGTQALTWGSSDDGERGAAVLAVAHPEHPPTRRVAWA
jgi:3-oxoacyl-[acyl-carrier-protein] synthase-1